jgi:antigen polymerase
MSSNYWTLILEFALLSMLTLAIIIYSNRKNFFSFFNIYTIFYWIVMYSGIIIYYFLYKDFGFDLLNPKYILMSIFYSSIAYAIFFISYKIFSQKFKIKIFPRVNYVELRVLAFTLLFMSIISVLIYVIQNGGFLLLKSDSYSDRFTSTLGKGWLTILFPFFIFSYSLFFFIKPSYKKWKIYFFLGFLTGTIIFIAIGGGRLLIALHVFTFLIIGYHYRFIKLKRIFMIVIILIPVSALLAFARAKMDFDSNLFQGLIFTMNTFSPFDSFVRILTYYDNEMQNYQGLSVVYNQFISSFVPRALFPDKPMIVMNTGNFYTQNILHYQSLTTISPSLNGSFYIMYGLIGLILGSIFMGFLMKLLDNTFYKNIFLKNPLNRTIDKRYTPILYLSFYHFILLNLFVALRDSIDFFLIVRFFYPYMIILLVLLLIKIAFNR